MAALKQICLSTTLLLVLLNAATCLEDSFLAGNSMSFVGSNQLNITSKTRFLTYDVNMGEGFNLRRDVYGRVANLVKHMNDRGENWILVLPPWRHLYHWKSRYHHQEALPWRNFFDLPNMNLYVPVMEFEDFLQITGGLEHVLYLQSHREGFSNGFKEIVEFEACQEDNTPYRKDETGIVRGYFWEYQNVFPKKFDCVSAQGFCLVLADFLKKIDSRSIFVDRFEKLLHVNYGSVEFYRATRSLVFAKHLRIVADQYRLKYLKSNDKRDQTPYNDEDWRKQVPECNSASGGPYIGLHMRRADYVQAHKARIPSIKELGENVKIQLEKYKLNKVYVSTDGTQEEIDELQSYFSAKVYHLPKPKELIEKYHDGGVAIIEQWIVSHARYFIGTCSSTFSFRIYEQRDILGFNEKTTYNCFCGAQATECEEPTGWRVAF